jgi:hypothetical protein
MIGIGAAAIWLTSSAFSDQYDDLVKKGYRWVTTDGSCACASKDDELRVIKNQSDDSTLRLVSKGGVYFLIRGVIVQVLQEDRASGLSQVHWEGIAANLWTPSKFLSKRPVTNALGAISVPGQPVGVNIPGLNSQLGATATPRHGEAAEPGPSPTP